MYFKNRAIFLYIYFLLFVSLLVGCGENTALPFNSSIPSENSYESLSQSDSAHLNNIDEKYGLNVDEITNLIIRNTEYYNKYLYFWHGRGVESGNNLIKLVFADITGDGFPEIFVGGRNGLEDTKYTAYTNDLSSLLIGEETTEVPDGIAISCVSNWGGINQLGEIPNGYPSSFLFGKEFIQLPSGQSYFYVRGGNGLFGAGSETYCFTHFWNQNGKWETKVTRGPQIDYTDRDIADPYYRIAVAEKEVFFGTSAKGFEAEILGNVNACIAQYDKRVSDLQKSGISNQVFIPIDLSDASSLSEVDALLADTKLLKQLEGDKIFDVRCVIDFEEIREIWGEPQEKKTRILTEQYYSWDENKKEENDYWRYERDKLCIVVTGHKKRLANEKEVKVASNIYIYPKDSNIKNFEFVE